MDKYFSIFPISQVGEDTEVTEVAWTVVVVHICEATLETSLAAYGKTENLHTI